MKIRTFTAGAFGENGYLVTCDGEGTSVVIDPGAGTEALLGAVDDNDLEIAAILLTHAHIDHIEGVAAVHERSSAPIHLHAEAEGMYQALPRHAERFGMSMDAPPPPDRELSHGQTVEFGDCAFQVRYAPGHAPGHVILWEEDEGVAFVGDVVFRGSIGRTDLPGGDFKTLMKSIREQVLTLPDDTRLLSGHGPETLVGDERVGNPFLIPHYGGELA